MKDIKIDIWSDKNSEWIKYSLEDMEDYFHFESKPNFSDIDEVHLHDAGYSNDTWIEIVFKNENSKIYNKVFGTYVEQ